MPMLWTVPVPATLLLLTALLSGCRTEDPQARKAAAVRTGDEASAAKQYDRAAAAYRQAVDVDPNDGPLRVKLAIALEQSQQWLPAASQAMRAADLLPTDFQARLLAARLILLQSRFEDSTKLIDALLRERPTDIELLVLSGTAEARLISTTWALFKLGPTGALGPQYDEGCTSLRARVGPEQDLAAERALRRAVELDPASPDARLALVNFLWAARRPEEGAGLLQTLADEQPFNPLVNETAGHYFLARGQEAVGEKYLKNAASTEAPYNRGPSLALADYYVRRDRFADALTQLSKFPSDDDEGGVIAAQRADVHLRLDHYDLAAQEIDAILARYPKHRRALALKAMLFMELKRPGDALVTAREAVAADRTSAEARVVLAEALTAAGDQAGAFAEYVEALRLAPALTHLVPIVAKLGLATGRHQQALAFARQAVALFPQDSEAKLAVAAALVRLRDHAAAATALQPLLAQKPRPLSVHVLLG